jgi:serine/threonine protein kinase
VAPIQQVTVIDDRYEVVGRLDAGGTGVVYQAVDRRLARTVAVKVVRTTDPRMAERSAREARLLARVDHPNVVRVYDAGIHDEHPYVVTELVSGRPLSKVISRGPLAPNQVAAIGAEAAAGLAATHRAGIVHRDLKPANILVSDRGVVRLLDYGVASVDDLDTLTLDGEVVGTPRYLAPEQVSGGAVGPAADVYALGLVLIECLAGHHPFEGTAFESMDARVHRDPVVPELLGGTGTALLAAMTSRSAGDRPSAVEASEVLTGLGAGADLRQLGAPARSPADPTLYLDVDATATGSANPTSITAPAPTAVATPSHASRSRRRWWLAFVLVAALLAAGSVAGARVLADRADHGTTPTTSTEPPPTTTSTTRAPTTTTTVRPTTTTAPPTTTTTTKGHGHKGKGGRPGG